MGLIIRRAVLPVSLVIGGAASLIFGAMLHSVLVVVERETQTTVEIPTVFPPLPPGQPPEGGFRSDEVWPFGEAPPPSDGDPFNRPPVMKETVTRIERTTIRESEPALTREVTVGGVTLLASGELKRTYSGDKGPSLCPT